MIVLTFRKIEILSSCAIPSCLKGYFLYILAQNSPPKTLVVTENEDEVTNPPFESQLLRSEIDEDDNDD